MCGSSPPPDHSVELARMEQEAARREEARLRAEEKANEKRFNSNLSGSFNAALQQAKNYFTSQGVLPQEYMTDITSELQAMKGMVPYLAEDPGSYFTGAGEKIYKQANDSFINKQMNTLRNLLPSNLATDRINDTADDATIAAILGEQKSEAQQYLDNLLARGVITNTGYTAGTKNLDTQSGTAQAKLNELGMQVLNSGRSDIDSIISKAMQSASNLRLGDQFDPYSYKDQTNSKLNDFFQNLGTTLRGKITGPLFETSGLANVAGAAQGAGNTKFNPNALAGIFGDDEEDDKTGTGSTGSTSTSPFG